MANPVQDFIAVVIPCYRVKTHILDVLQKIGPECSRIYIIDDGCPDATGKFVEENCSDIRVKVIYNSCNEGVGGAVIRGYLSAMQDGAMVIVKIDGDGQMDPAFIPQFVTPILSGEADYVKGNRFYNPEDIQGMPLTRVLGNAALSFFSKLSSGYWNIFDPTNGYTAIHTALVMTLPLHKISKDYFFETDMLFRLGTLRARVIDMPMQSVYLDENSNLSIKKIAPYFISGHLRNLYKRILYSYFLRDFSVASLEIVFGIILLLFGTVFGIVEWIAHARNGTYASTGTVMLASLPILTGIQMLISAVNFDIRNIPDRPVHKQLWLLQSRKKGPK